MKANKRRDTKPERQLRSALHRRGWRFRVDHRVRLGRLSGRPDIVFLRHRVAVYVDGCFWHRCPIHATSPRANASFWTEKLDANVARDERMTALLKDAGWRVLRIWEHVPVAEAVQAVEQVLAGAHDSAASAPRASTPNTADQPPCWLDADSADDGAPGGPRIGS